MEIGAHPASYTMGARCIFPEEEVEGHEAGHSLPPSGEV
jgi:hypothetical protein